IKVGDVLLAQGDRAGALKAYRGTQAILERLAAADPSNAGWQRDLIVSYWRMADIAEKSGQDDARAWWRKAYEQISSMKRRGILAPADEKYVDALKEKAGG
ncbi:MAG: tetratricopeptide repeat-containing protein, partial [Candidatus Eisenbacteria bacterium]|nr:tetratricopeptide repeat-containing protein [Candidatus Eisenbacteria bacterium]